MGEIEKRIMTQEERELLCKKDMEEWKITSKKADKRIYNHLIRFYREGNLDIKGFLKGANEIINKLFQQSWENNKFWNIEKFKEFLEKGLRLYVLKFNLDYETSKKLRKSIGRYKYMYGELVEFGEEITDGVNIYLKENRNNEQKKEEIKELIEKDYEIFFGEGSREKILDTKVGKAKNDIIEVFSRGYYSVNSNGKPEE